jgi:Stress responsive A/B Barrel Domain
MRKTVGFAIAAAVAAGGLFAFFGQGTTEAGKKGEAMLSHDVYFSLTDNSPKARHELVDLCKKYLSKHPGEVFFAVGPLAEDLKREVNDRDFDVALHIVFKDLAAHEKYQDAERHKQFIEAGKANWKKVRVFDSYVTQ